MSLDIFLQGFRTGEAASVDVAMVRETLDPFVTETGDGWMRVAVEDGGAEVYGTDDLSTGLMVSRLSGRAIWDVLFEVKNCRVCNQNEFRDQ